jgi:cell division protein FtsB
MKLPNLSKIKKLSDHATTNNAVLACFLVVGLLTAWSTAGVIAKNYRLEKQQKQTEAQVEIAKLNISNQKLKNVYVSSTYYQEIVSRRELGLSAPGERVINVPHKIIESKIAQLPSLNTTEQSSTVDLLDNRSNVQKNLSSWIDLFTGKQLE